MNRARTQKSTFFHEEQIVQTGKNSKEIVILDIKNNVGTKTVKKVVNGKTTSSKKTKLSRASIMKESKKMAQKNHFVFPPIKTKKRRTKNIMDVFF
jgi:hypothetical protein